MDAEDILDTLKAYVYSKDLDGNYTYANRSVQKLFGADLAGIVGKDDSEFFDLERSNELRANDQEVLNTGNTVSREERNIIEETGEERVYWTVKSAVRDEVGTVVGMCGVSIDITS